MSLGKRQEVRKTGVVVGYVEHVALGDLWRAVPFGVAPYLPPMFGMKVAALEFVRKYGRTKHLKENINVAYPSNTQPTRYSRG